MIHESIVTTIGNTPIVRLNRTGPEKAEIYVKVESFNPGASVKDRLAWGIIQDAEKSGALKPGQTVIEATSGNTGIALAMVCASRGYPFVAVMAESFSVERRRIMKALGARVILTPAAAKGSGMVAKAEELAEAHGWYLTRQFQNEANPAYHRSTTGPEIVSAFAGRRFDYWVTGWGTGGTMTGAGQVIKTARPEVKVIAVEPENAAMLAGKPWESHPIQGWNPDFIPEVLDSTVADELITVTGIEARDTSLLLARNEGILAGISAGGTLAGAIKVAERSAPGTVLLAMLPDTGERYMSTILFEDISEDSDDDWLASL